MAIDRPAGVSSGKERIAALVWHARGHRGAGTLDDQKRLLLMAKNEEPSTFAGAQGHRASSPWQMPLAAWKQILGRTWRQTWLDNVGLVAAGVAFYGFLALVPLLGMIVLAYGFIADPQSVVANMRALTAILPVDIALLIGEQLMGAVQTSQGTKGAGLLLGLAVALYGASNGAGAVITALNIAYHENEKRSLLRFYAIALVMTLAAVVLAVAALTAITALAFLNQLLPQASGLEILAGKAAAYVGLLLATAGIAATLYRFAPSREEARWTWITPGSLFTAVFWLVLTLLFGFYVSHIADYNATYGSLGAIIGLLTWMYLSAYVFIIGAELNSEIEHQTAKDSTTGAPEPMGQRGAWSADHIAEGADPAQQVRDNDEGPSLGSAGPPVPATEPAAP